MTGPIRRLLGPVWMSLALMLPAMPAAHASDADRAAVRETVERFFAAMHEQDRDTLQRLALADGRGIAVRAGEGAADPDARSMAELIDSIMAGEAPVIERMWNPEIRIDLIDSAGEAGIATLWAPYDFWLDGEFHHCGIDAFHLVKTAGDWRIAGVIWTSRTEGCPASPLGPAVN